jgi:opacity protein-like surface antigen
VRFSTSISAAVCLLVASSVAKAEDLGHPIDLSAFSREASDAADTAAAEDVLPVSLSDEPAASRFYVAGIVGASFATLTSGGSFESIPGSVFSPTGSVNDTLFTGGGAVGMAFAKSSGQLRMELEGRDRGAMSGPTTLNVSGGTILDRPMTTTASGVWSFMTNFWRDYDLTSTLGLYAGGGIGIGGYQYQTRSLDPDLVVSGANTINSFAWQAGTGVTYQVSSRVTFDVGYRFFSIGDGSTPLLSSGSTGGGPPYFFFGNSVSSITASELLLSVRIYEPFRGLIR